MKRQYTHIVLKFLFLIALLFIVDRSVGAIFERLKNIGLEKTPNVSRTEYTIKKVDAEVLVMGSSRAMHHYIPSILSDSLNKTVFNCGLGGQKFPYSVAMTHMVLKRYTPEIIIIDILPLLDTNSSYGSMYELYPYYNDKLLKEIIIYEDSKNRFKMLSKMYRYNSRILSIVNRIFSTDLSLDNGYRPLYSNEEKHPDLKEVEYSSNTTVDPYYLELLLYCIGICKEKNVNLVFSISPQFQKSNIAKVSSFICLKKILAANNIPIIYMAENTVINDSTLYREVGHLNHNGATAFTQAFVGQLKEVLEK